jgi:hypothetical protein
MSSSIKRRAEPTQKGNPYALTRHQHIHSKAAILRFANKDGKIRILLKSPPKDFISLPDNHIFCGERIWSEKLERGLFKKVEDRFQEECDLIERNGVVSDHRAISEYLFIWSKRFELKKHPPDDITLDGISSQWHEKNVEEILEKKGAIYFRGTAIPGRLAVGFSVVRDLDVYMSQFGYLRWGVIVVDGKERFICPDNPGYQLFIPITPEISLCANYPNCTINDSGVMKVNSESWSITDRFVFGNPETMSTLANFVLETSNAV